MKGKGRAPRVTTSVGDINVALVVHGDPVRLVKSRFVAADNALRLRVAVRKGWKNLDVPTIAPSYVRHVNCALPIDRDAGWAYQTGVRASDDADGCRVAGRAGRVDQDARREIVLEIHDVYIARLIERDAQPAALVACCCLR